MFPIGEYALIGRRFALLSAALLGFAVPVQAQTATAPLPTFALTIRDGAFSPKRLDVPAGTRVKIVLKNAGPGPLEFENAEMNVEKVLAPNAESFVVLPRLTPGEYEFVDEYNMVTGVMTIIAK